MKRRSRYSLRLRQRQRNKIVSLAIKCLERPELFLHFCKWLIMRIIRICTLHVCNGVRRTETGQNIHVTVGIISDDGSMVKPKDALKPEGTAEFLFDFLLTEILVTVY